MISALEDSGNVTLVVSEKTAAGVRRSLSHTPVLDELFKDLHGLFSYQSLFPSNGLKRLSNGILKVGSPP